MCQIYWFISPCVLLLYSGIVLGLLVYLFHLFICQCNLSARFIGLFGSFGLSVSLTMLTFTEEWDCVQFIDLFGLLLYFTMLAFTGNWDSVRFIWFIGLLVYFTVHTFTGEWDTSPLPSAKNRGEIN